MEVLQLKGHLGNPQELLKYTLQMQIELDKHKKEKKSLRYVNALDVNASMTTEIHKRTKQIQDTDLYYHNNFIQKQYVHIGNYAMFGYLNALNFKGINDT